MVPILLFTKTHGVVRPDKKPQSRLTAASGQPVTSVSPADNRQESPQNRNASENRSHGSENRRTEYVGARVTPHIKTEVQRRATLQKRTESRTVALLLEQAITQSMGLALGLELKQANKDSIKEELSRFGNRTAAGAFSARAEATLGRIYNEIILSLVLKDNVKLFEEYQQAAREQARSILYPKKGEK